MLENLITSIGGYGDQGRIYELKKNFFLIQRNNFPRKFYRYRYHFTTTTNNNHPYKYPFDTAHMLTDK